MKRLTAFARWMLTEHREGTFYLIFGVLTTVVNYGVFFAFHLLWGDKWVLINNFIAFVAAVLFAYVTNKQYVFQSLDWSLSTVRRELASFAAARVFSFLVEEAGLWFAAYVLHLDQARFLGLDGILLAKLALNVVVVILNYFLSKFLVFRRKE